MGCGTRLFCSIFCAERYLQKLIFVLRNCCIFPKLLERTRFRSDACHHSLGLRQVVIYGLELAENRFCDRSSRSLNQPSLTSLFWLPVSHWILLFRCVEISAILCSRLYSTRIAYCSMLCSLSRHNHNSFIYYPDSKNIFEFLLLIPSSLMS